LLLLQVSEAMSGKDKVISVKPSTPMSEAAHLMLHHDVSCTAYTEVESLYDSSSNSTVMPTKQQQQQHTSCCTMT
jgi:CBS domain-containing protein